MKSIRWDGGRIGREGVHLVVASLLCVASALMVSNCGAAEAGAVLTVEQIQRLLPQIRARYPDQYGDWSDEELEAALRAWVADRIRATADPEREPSAGLPPRKSVADRIRATGFAAAKPSLSDEDLVKRAESIDAEYARAVINILCEMAAEVEFGMIELELSMETRGGIKTFFVRPDKNIYAVTLKAAKLAWNLRKEAEKRGGSCDAAHGTAGRMKMNLQ